MKYYLLLIALLTLSCRSEPFSPAGHDPNVVSVKYGQQIELPNKDITIKFIDIEEDSRCPEGAECVWAGNARILIHINQKEFKLNSYLDPKEIKYTGYNMALEKLEPHPKLDQKFKKEQYVATLQFSSN